ncbi:MAG TPA: RNase adapter RapZ, partial [Burkholderiaceae bacterium]|nr:RNase adapter RapZ [Burkholderiaceae bacterium]
MLNIVLITGISGSGKSVALRVLEDAGYICVDNLPVRFLDNFIATAQETGLERIAVAMDVRWPGELQQLPEGINALRQRNALFRVIFLEASDHALRQRYSESRRRHPLTDRLATQSGKTPSLQQCIDAERDMLSPLREQEHTIDTTDLTPGQL